MEKKETLDKSAVGKIVFIVKENWRIDGEEDNNPDKIAHSKERAIEILNEKKKQLLKDWEDILPCRIDDSRLNQVGTIMDWEIDACSDTSYSIHDEDYKYFYQLSISETKIE